MGDGRRDDRMLWKLTGWGLVTLAAALFLWRCHRFGGFYAEDAYISFRFARHLAEGHGLVWNIGGAPVEGYTSPLHIALLALTLVLGAPVTVSAVVIGIVSVLGAAALCLTLLRRETGRIAPLATVALGFWLVDPRLAIHATAGLDTAMYMALLPLNLLVGVRLLDAPGRRRAAALAAINFCCLLGRPDAAPFLLGQGLVLGFEALRRARHGDRKLLSATVTAYALLVVAGLLYLGAKFLYFGYVLPNPFYIKSSTPGELHGLDSVVRYLRSMWRLLPLAPFLLFVDYGRLFRCLREPGRPSSVALATVPPAVFLAYYTTVVPEVNYLHRFEYPTYLFLIYVVGLVATFGRPLERLRDALARWTGPRVAGGLLGLGLVGLLGYGYTSTWIRFPWFEIVETRYYRPIGEALARTGLGPAGSLVIDSAGVVPYTSGFTHIDPVGLTDNVLSGREPIDVWQRETYIFEQCRPDLYIGPEPPAAPGATGCSDDPVIGTEYVQKVLLAPDRFRVLMGYLKAYGGLSKDELCAVMHHRMRELRDHWTLVGELPYPVDAPRGYTTFAYVRTASPNAETIARAMSSVVARSADEIDRSFPLPEKD